MRRTSLVIWMRKHNPSLDSWSKVALPLIKSIMPTFYAKELISVQPMSSPVGKILYMDFVHGLIVITWDEELWWEDDGKGGLYCPQTQQDHRISDHDWIEQRDERLIIPAWEVKQQEMFVDGLRNDQIKPFGYVHIDDIPFTGNKI